MRLKRALMALNVAMGALTEDGGMPSMIGVTVLVTHQGDESNSIDVALATSLDKENLVDTLEEVDTGRRFVVQTSDASEIIVGTFRREQEAALLCQEVNASLGSEFLAYFERLEGV